VIDDWVAGEELFASEVLEASLNLETGGLPLRLRDLTGSGRGAGTVIFRLGRVDLDGVSASLELESDNFRLRVAEVRILGGVAGGVPRSDSDESSG
jgi:hypothetical protein